MAAAKMIERELEAGRFEAVVEQGHRVLEIDERNESVQAALLKAADRLK
jgi:DNA-binding SARP family transcriptional activator